MEFHSTLKLEDLWDGEMIGVHVQGKKVLLIRKDEDVFAYEDRCSHKSVSLSEWGNLKGEVLICKMHDWQYDVRTGSGLNPTRVKLKSYPVRIQDGFIFVGIEKKQ